MTVRLSSRRKVNFPDSFAAFFQATSGGTSRRDNRPGSVSTALGGRTVAQRVAQ